MEDIVRWVGEQLDTDERILRAAADELGGLPLGGEWTYDGQYVLATHERNLVAVGSQDFMSVEIGRHIKEWDPSRVLREIDAKRKLLILHRPVRRADFTESDGSPAGPMVVCHECDANTTDADWPDTPCWTLRFLAAPYDDRPGYKEDWRP